MGYSYLLPTLVSLQNANKEPFELSAESEDFIGVCHRWKKDTTVMLKTACPTALNLTLALVAQKILPYIS